MQHATYFVVLFTIELIESRLIGVAGVIVEQTAYDSNEAFVSFIQLEILTI